MRILSKFHDYYDTAMQWGSDPSILYVRKEHELEDKDKLPELEPLFNAFDELPKARGFVDVNLILFCGVCYPLFRKYFRYEKLISYKTPEELLQSISNEEIRRGTTNLYWDFGRVRNSAELLAAARERRSTLHSLPFNNQGLLEWQKSHKDLNVKAIACHQAYNAPIINFYRALGSTRVVLNPKLQEVGFASFVPPYQAFQEIEMFLGGVLTTPPQEPRLINDDVIRDSKGFNNRSFRMDSPGKKLRRRNRKKV